MAPDGREILFGLDWKHRKQELLVRCGGRCEHLEPDGYPPFVRQCKNEARDPDHIVKRSKGRDDRISNLQALCGFHHDLKHPEFKPRWTKRASA